MAILKKKTAKKEVVVKKEGTTRRTMAHVLLRPRITEKASQMSMDHNVYTFEVPESASKRHIALAVKDFYKVTPVKVATVHIPRKSVVVRGQKGMKAGGKKAYVYLKKGDKIEFV